MWSVKKFSQLSQGVESLLRSKRTCKNTMREQIINYTRNMLTLAVTKLIKVSCRCRMAMHRTLSLVALFRIWICICIIIYNIWWHRHAKQALHETQFVIIIWAKFCNLRNFHEFSAGFGWWGVVATAMASRKPNRRQANLNLFALMDAMRVCSCLFDTRQHSMFDTRRPTTKKLMQYSSNIYILWVH